MHKRLSLLMAVLMVLALFTVPLDAKYMGEEQLQERTHTEFVAKEYGLGGFMLPYPTQPIVDKAKKFIDGFNTTKTTRKEQLDEISKYLILSGYTYKGSEGEGREGLYRNYINNNQLNCYGYTLFASKLLLKQNIPHKIILVKTSKGDTNTAHTAILVNTGDKWVGYEPTFAMYYNYYRNYGLSKDEAVKEMQEYMVYKDLKNFCDQMNEEGTIHDIYVSPCLKKDLVGYNFKHYKQEGKLDLNEILK